MVKIFTLEYWKDNGWYVGRLNEIPGVFSQGETLQELEDNIRDAYRLMKEDTEILTHSEIKKSLCELIRKQLGLK